MTLFFDGDGAGRKATLAAREPCKEAGLVVSVASLPEGRDPDDVAREGGSEGVRRYVKSAKSLLEYRIDTTLLEGHLSTSDPQAIAARIRAVEEIIRLEDDPAVRRFAQGHADAIAKRLNIGDAQTLRDLDALVQRAASGGDDRSVAKSVPPPPERARSRERRRDIGLEVLGALLDFPALLESDAVEQAALALDGDTALAVAAVRQDDGGLGNPEQLLAKLPASIHPFAAARLAAPQHQSLDDARAELLGNVEKLKRLELTRHKAEVIEELARFQSSGDFDQEIALLGEQARRAREHRGL